MASPKYLSENENFKAEQNRLVELRRETKLSGDRMRKLVNEFDSVADLPAKISTAHSNAQLNEKAIADLKLIVTDSTKVTEAIKAEAEGTKEKLDKLLKKKTIDSQTITDQIAEAKDANAKAIAASDSLNRIREEITNQLGRAASGTLSNTFENRAKKISLSKWVWFTTLVGLVVASPFIAVYVFTSLDPSEFVGSNLLAINVFRLGALSPLIFLIGFASIQYSRERETQEKYEFKTSTARSLPAYTKMVKEEFYDGKIKGRETDLMDFVFESMRKVYEEPIVKKRDLHEISENARTAMVNGAKKISTGEKQKVALNPDKKRVTSE